MFHLLSCPGAKLGLNIREEHGLRAFANKVLRRIFGPRRYAVTGK
jgi:hypothetical protein